MTHPKTPSTPIDLGELAAALTERGVPTNTADRDAGTVVSGIAQHSDLVVDGDLFAALGGTRADGAAYIERARGRGAAAVLCAPGVDTGGLPALRTDQCARATGQAAALLAGDPSAAMQVVAITGTNGKTSVAYLLESILAAAGRRVGLLGTIAQRWPGVERVAALTTPSACEIQSVLAEMREAGVDCVAMEVSSHALHQHRVAGCRFAVGIFTNLTRDHLDYHQTEQAYFDAKAALLRDYVASSKGAAVLYVDDPRVAALADELTDTDVWTVSTRPDQGARVWTRVLHADLQGMQLELSIDGKSTQVDTRLIGDVNAANIALAAAAATALGVATDAIVQGLAEARPVPGRLERIGDTSPAVIVDYAHTPDALERTIASLRPFVAGRLIVVFGCGGDRDKGKRPLMGAVAAKGADVVIVTSDNPRTEEPDAIIDDVVVAVANELALRDEGSLRAGADGYLREGDRRRAIEIGVTVANAQDTVLVAGKGHEDYQEINGVRHELDDRAIVAGLSAQSGTRQ